MDSDWASVPQHLLDCVLEKVETVGDYMEFELVCTSWHSAATTNNQRSVHIRNLPHVPMLLLPNEDDSNHSHTMYNVITRRFSYSNLVLPFDDRFTCFTRGWLVVIEKDYSVTLYKASSMSEGAAIKLPQLYPNYDPNLDDIYDGCKVAITSDPLLNPDECVIAVIFGGSWSISLMRPDKDKSWTSVQGITLCNDILYYNDQFYVVNHRGSMFSFKPTYPFDVKPVAPDIPRYIVGKTYLVDLQQRFIQVVRYLDHDTVGREMLGVEVFELDIHKKLWVPIFSLGDTSLFLGDNYSIAISSSNFPQCQPNRIYFTHDNDYFGDFQHPFDDFGEYDLQSSTWDPHFGLDSTFIAKTMSKRGPIWIIPNAQ